MTGLIWILGVSLSLSFLCSILEAVLLSVTRSWVGVLRERGARAGDLFDHMLRQIDEPIAAVLTLNTIAHTVGASMGGAMALEVFGDRWIALFSAALTLLILLFSEIIPKTVGATHWKVLSVPTAHILQILIVVLKPILIPLSWLNRLIQPRSGHGSSVSRAEIEVLVEIGRREGSLEEYEWSFLRNVLGLNSMTVEQVMTPRTDIAAVPMGATVGGARDLILEAGHSRMPVFEKDLDHIRGFVTAKDLLAAADSPEVPLSRLVRPIKYSPERKPLEDLIVEMREEGAKMVIVIDEFGGTAGLATLEDLVQEIIGEIRDHDNPEGWEDIVPLEDGTVLVRGEALVRKVREALPVGFSEDDSERISGFILRRLGRTARVGDTVKVAGGEFRVTRVGGHRILALRFLPESMKLESGVPYAGDDLSDAAIPEIPDR